MYLDHHAGTPLADAAREAMRAAAEEAWANPSSPHRAGRRARAHAARARRCVASGLGAAPADLVFTGGGTEACNLMVLGGPRPSRVVTTVAEHPAVIRACEAWAAEGVELRRLPLPGGRAPAPEVVEAMLGAGVLFAFQWVNHETGTRLPAAEWTALARARGARVVVDASQALGRLPVDVTALGADAVAVAAPKIGGPAGAGALWIRRDSPVQPRELGGSQERGRRAGSPDVLALAGFGGAAEALPARLAAMERIGAWRDRLEARLRALGGVVNGAAGPRVASAVNASFRGWRGPELVAALDLEGLQASAGAACSAGLDAPSEVLLGMYPEEPWRASSCLRLSLGPEGLDEGSIDAAEAALARVIPRGR
ncbi:MAG: aminotransferase class V-fold PLP-dependent enzyme [Myxococcota bacterium]